jgi:hypothetical protein
MVYSSLLFSSLDLLPEEIFGTEEVPSTSSPIPPLKEKMPRRNKGQTINCAIAFGI